MGRLREAKFAYQDAHKGSNPTMRDLAEFIAQTGGRAGLADEQLREVGDE